MNLKVGMSDPVEMLGGPRIEPGGDAAPKLASYRCKRVLDWVVLVLIAVPALLVTLLAIVAIWCEDRGPVFFRQVRIGLEGRPFTLLKLRTMHTEASPESEVPEADHITRVGRLLRRLSVDELPQLLNVARGEMSLVGPRPHLRDRVQQYNARDVRRLDVLPGLTGLAQTAGRNRLDWDVRTEYDLVYVGARSLALDLAILLRTVRVVLSGTDLYGHPCQPSLPMTDSPLDHVRQSGTVTLGVNAEVGPLHTAPTGRLPVCVPEFRDTYVLAPAQHRRERPRLRRITVGHLAPARHSVSTRGPWHRLRASKT